MSTVVAVVSLVEDDVSRTGEDVSRGADDAAPPSVDVGVAAARSDALAPRAIVTGSSSPREPRSSSLQWSPPLPPEPPCANMSGPGPAATSAVGGARVAEGGAEAATLSTVQAEATTTPPASRTAVATDAAITSPPDRASTGRGARPGVSATGPTPSPTGEGMPTAAAEVPAAATGVPAVAKVSVVASATAHAGPTAARGATTSIGVRVSAASAARRRPMHTLSAAGRWSGSSAVIASSSTTTSVSSPVGIPGRRSRRSRAAARGAPS